MKHAATWAYSFRLAARVLLYAPSHRQDSTYHDLCYTSRGALAETRNSSMGPLRRIDPTIPSHHERTLHQIAHVSLFLDRQLQDLVRRQKETRCRHNANCIKVSPQILTAANVKMQTSVGQTVSRVR